MTRVRPQQYADELLAMQYARWSLKFSICSVIIFIILINETCQNKNLYFIFHYLTAFFCGCCCSLCVKK